MLDNTTCDQGLDFHNPFLWTEQSIFKASYLMNSLLWMEYYLQARTPNIPAICAKTCVNQWHPSICQVIPLRCWLEC